MKKTLLLFALLLSAMNMMGQAYEFNTKEKSLNSGLRSVTCKMENVVELNSVSPDISIMMWDYSGEDRMPFVGFHLCKYAFDAHKNSLAVTKIIRELAFSLPKDEEIKDNVPINLYLSNGDILHAKNRGSETSVSSVQRGLMERTDSVGVIDAYVGLSCFKSTKIPRQIQTRENTQVICQQLRTYDIVKIEVDGVSFDVRGLRSAATFDAMFDALAAKTGKGHLYRSSDTSSFSTSVSSGPSASCELGYVGVYSWGGIGCRVDNLKIFGAKGKDAEICAVFESTTLEDVGSELSKE